MRDQLRPSLVLLAEFTVITGLVYPAVVTVATRAAFPVRAAGSLVVRDGHAVGSALIGQPFSNPVYFWPRPSATGPVPYDAGSSSGSNLGPLNPVLTQAVADRVRALRASDPGNTAAVPVDLVTASASGLDPHISPGSALFQVLRVARARGLDSAVVRALVERHVEGRQFGLLGEPRVNVLALNLALDSLAPVPPHP